MKKEIKVPSMGESITEATIGAILKPTGTIVAADEEVLELETDKVNQVLFAPQKGVITISVKTGDVVKIGQVIGSVESDQKADNVEPAKKEEEPKSAEPAKKEEDLKSKPEIKKTPDQQNKPPVRISIQEGLSDLSKRRTCFT